MPSRYSALFVVLVAVFAFTAGYGIAVRNLQDRPLSQFVD